MLRPFHKHFIILLLSSAVAATAAPNPFRNTSNAHFRSRCNGPQGALVVTDSKAGVANTLAWSKTTPTATAAAASDPMQYAHNLKTLQWMQAKGLKSSKARLTFPRQVVHVDAANKLVLPDLARTQQVGTQGNDLTFTWTGWTTSEQAELQTYLTTAYPRAKMVYGAPAFSATINIIKDTSVTAIQGGVYDVSADEIHMAALSGNSDEDTFTLLFLVLQAFHGNATLFYDAWEQGMAGAAATAIQTDPTVDASYDPTNPGPFYALSVYEAENLPELGNNTFYPASGFSGMLTWRIAMARSAWLKCWIENSNFFSNFNQLYYANYDSDLPGDVPRLTDLAAQALPTVESLPFATWYQQQYVLDTSVSVGPKLFTWNIPLADAVALISEDYFTDTTGSETAQGGTATLNYFSYDFSTSLYAEEGNAMQVPATGDGAGEGTLIPTFYNVGGSQLITVQIALNNMLHQYPYPYNERGSDGTGNNFYGGIINNTTGAISATGGSSAINATTVSEGVWGGQVSAAALSPSQIQVTYTNPSSQTSSRTVNVGWDSYVMFMDGGTQAGVSLNLSNAPPAMYMISLPVTPLTVDASATLGIPAQDLLLMRWDPSLSAGQGYRFYPFCQPFAPGRGYWIKVLNNVQQNITGSLPNTGASYSVPLGLGWNQIGSPRLASVAVTDLQVAIGDQDPVSLATAVTNQYVQQGIFAYSQTQGYQLTDTIDPLAGYWIRCLNQQGASLIFPAATTGTSSVKVASLKSTTTAAAAPNPLLWSFHVNATAGTCSCTGSYLGAAKKATDGFDVAYDIAGPPAALGDYVTVAFPHTNWGALSGNYIADIRAPSLSTRVWQATMTSTALGVPVTVSWPDLSNAPAAIQPTFVDAQTGKKVNMRTTASYTYPAVAGQGITRSFSVEVPVTLQMLLAWLLGKPL
jgi:hypothetical protein